MYTIFNQPSQFTIGSGKQIAPLPESYIFVVDNKNNIFLLNNQVPTYKQIDKNIINSSALFLFGYINDVACYCCFNNNLQNDNNLTIQNIKTSYQILNLEYFQASLLANHIVYWLRTHKFCGLCGNKNHFSNKELSLQCTSCNNTTYPSIAPCVIGLIYNKDKILLAKNNNNTSNVYSCIAGFVNPCESLECALEREVYEEVGLKIKNIKYTSSQQWPFPHSLMMGFTAEYDSGEIKIDYNELSDARWFKISELDQINLPSEISIANHLIKHYILCNDNKQ